MASSTKQSIESCQFGQFPSIRLVVHSSEGFIDGFGPYGRSRTAPEALFVFTTQLL